MSRLYIGNLPYSIDEKALTQILVDRGFKSASRSHIVKQPEDGRSKGFGFIELSSDAEAAEAIKMLDGADVEGRALRVALATKRPERRPRRDA